MKTSVDSSLFCQTCDSPLGSIAVVADSDAVVRIEFLDQREAKEFADNLAQCLKLPVSLTENTITQQAVTQINEYFAGTRQSFDLPLAPNGTEFQRQAWQQLQAIGYGQTRSYGEQAQAIGNPKAVRAVGSANSRNPIAVVIPCHRVIGSNGTLTGYAGGLDKKQWLLDWERAQATTM